VIGGGRLDPPAPPFRANSRKSLLAATKPTVATDIGFLEQGRREPSLSTLLILAKTLKVPVQTLVENLPVPKKRRPACGRGGRRRRLTGRWRARRALSVTATAASLASCLPRLGLDALTRSVPTWRFGRRILPRRQ
jgi:hypothetical protein